MYLHALVADDLLIARVDFMQCLTILAFKCHFLMSHIWHLECQFWHHKCQFLGIDVNFKAFKRQNYLMKLETFAPLALMILKFKWSKNKSVYLIAFIIYCV